MNKILVLLVLLCFVLFPTYSDSNGIWTYPRDIQPGIFGEDESVDYVNDFYQFDHQVYFNNNVGIGTTTPSYKLDINGNISSTIFYDRDNPAYYINPFGSSRVQILNSDVYYSQGSNQYFLDPKDVSILNELRVSSLLVNGSSLDSLYVNEGQTDSITSSMIVNGAVSESDLAQDQIDDSEIQDNSLTASSLAENSVGASEIAASAVGTSEVADNSLTANDLATNSVGASEIADSSVDSAAIIDGTITISDVDVDSLNDTFATKTYVDSNNGIDSCKVCIACSDDGVWNGMVACDGPNDNGWNISSSYDHCADRGTIAVKFVCGTDSYSDTNPSLS